MRIAERFRRALKWIDHHSIGGEGIAVSSKSARSYPEVSGYFIPSLLAWNEIDRARGYGSWLISVQHADGSWGDPNLDEPYAFDTGQIIKGLLALDKAFPGEGWEPAVRRACNWMVSLVGDDGKPNAPDIKAWNGEVPTAVLLYSYEAVKRAAEHFQVPEWSAAVDRLVAWFLDQPELTRFSHLSHFHAYVLEALCDLGLHERAAEGMKEVAILQRPSGAVPGFAKVKWVCSTGLLQYAIVWYKLGDFERGNLAFDYATKLQNSSGGWWGSYGWSKKYFPRTEISWAVKYFLDALQLKLRASFESMAPIFSETIPRDDGRYRLVLDQVEQTGALTILDAGCGKGRYLRNLLDDRASASLFASDLSDAVMSALPGKIEKRQGSLLRLPYADGAFDLTYTVEALEHAVHIDGALRELLRVTKPGGTLIIIDKNARKVGRLELPDWEQWFDLKSLAEKLEELGCEVQIVNNVPYEGKADGLFAAWIAKKSAV